MIRKTLTILSLIGLLLSVCAWAISFGDGGFSISTNNYFYWASGCWFWFHDDYPDAKIDLRWFENGFRGFEQQWLPEFNPYRRGWRVGIPVWMPTILFALILYFCNPLYYYRLHNRKKLGLCLKCGYDLRASKDRCPECGEEFGSTNAGR